MTTTLRGPHCALLLAALGIGLVAPGCNGDLAGAVHRPEGAPADGAPGAGGPDAGQETPVDGPTPGPSCAAGRTYLGFDGQALERKRLDRDPRQNRLRLKPYPALRGEYARAVGAVPGRLELERETFNDAPERWFIEPRMSAIASASAYRVAFQACLGVTKEGSTFAAVPDLSLAEGECGTLAQQFWQRPALGAEKAACAQLVVADTAGEPDPRRRWAYGCATLLSASPFLSY